VWNVSTSGARIENALPPVGPGTRVWLRFSFYVGSFATEVAAEVVRRTETGFAVRFCELGPSQYELLRKALPAGGGPAMVH
jgi:hypothetical protein